MITLAIGLHRTMMLGCESDALESRDEAPALETYERKRNMPLAGVCVEGSGRFYDGRTRWDAQSIGRSNEDCCMIVC